MPEKLASETADQKTATLRKKKEQYVARGISSLAPIFIDKANGAIVSDIDGHKYIDFYGGIGVINAGHCPQPVVTAIKNQAEKLLHSCFMVGMYAPYVELAEKQLCSSFSA